MSMKETLMSMVALAGGLPLVKRAIRVRISPFKSISADRIEEIRRPCR